MQLGRRTPVDGARHLFGTEASDMYLAAPSGAPSSG